MYEVGLKSSYDDIISAVDDFVFFTYEIQVLQHRKKCVDYKWDYVEKYTTFCHIPYILDIFSEYKGSTQHSFLYFR